MNSANTVGQANDRALGSRFGAGIKIFNPLFNELTDFGWVQLRRHSLIPLAAFLLHLGLAAYRSC